MEKDKENHIVFSPQYKEEQMNKCKELRNVFISESDLFLKNEGVGLGIPDHIFIFRNPRNLSPNAFLLNDISPIFKKHKNLYPHREFISETVDTWYYTDTALNKNGEL